jgi:hypothetical protein
MKTVMAMMALAGLVSAGLAQEHKDMPKPGKEHSMLQQQFVGEWDAVMKHVGDGKKESKESKDKEFKGTETVKSAFDGYWLVIDFKGDMDGKSYTGHGSMGYDPSKKKYVMTWLDNMSPYSMWSEGTADDAGKTFTFTSEGYCPDLGKSGTFKTVFEVKDATHRTLTFYRTGKDGPEQKMGWIEYTRKS